MEGAAPRRPLRLAKNCPGVFGQPVNALEARLLAARAGEISMTDFVRELLESEVAVLVPEGQFEARDGGPRLVKGPILFGVSSSNHLAAALFTHASRGKPVTERHPDFRSAVAVNARDFIRQLPPGYALAINPYWDVNMEWNGEQVERMKAL